MVRLLLFLGAGASSPFGIPTMFGFIDEFTVGKLVLNSFTGTKQTLVLLRAIVADETEVEACPQSPLQPRPLAETLSQASASRRPEL